MTREADDAWCDDSVGLVTVNCDASLETVSDSDVVTCTSSPSPAAASAAVAAAVGELSDSRFTSATVTSSAIDSAAAV